MTPMGSTSSMASLRLNGAALACFVQSGAKPIHEPVGWLDCSAG
jgi:hypothetical protein